VTKKILSSEMGLTLPHEHIFVDARPLWSKPSREDKAKLVDARVSMEILGFLRHDMAVCKDNLVLDDPETAAKELLDFKALGGKTVVDVTSRGLSPPNRPTALRDLSNKVGLNIIAGCGYYTASTHPAEMVRKTTDQLADEMIQEIQVGFEGTDVKAGIIGEIGTSHPLAECEKRVLRAAAHAQKSTGVAVSVHLPWRGKHALQIVDMLESEGADAGKIIIGHMDDMEDMSFEYHKAIAERGVYLEFDCFGEEDYVEAENFVHPRDTERIAALKRLIDVGYIDSLLLSHDVCLKTYTRTYGGYGYDHIQRTIIPMLHRIGVTDAEVDHMMIQNTARAIAH
jgi:phosphotriesterase-related protein